LKMTTDNNEPIAVDELIRSHRRSISIELTPTGRVLVRAPHRAPLTAIMDFVRRKSGWIIEKRTLLEARTISTPKKQFVDGETFLFLGETYKLAVIENAEEYLRFENGFFLSAVFPYDRRELFVQWYKGKAKEVLSERVRHYAAISALRHAGVTVSDALMRWGSCSPEGRISFAWRLVMAPLPIVDYVVVHELAHIAESNHSARFWAKVLSIMPDYHPRRRWLKENGHALNF